MGAVTHPIPAGAAIEIQIEIDIHADLISLISDLHSALSQET